MPPIKPFYFDMDEADIAAFLEGAEKVLRSGNLILGDNTTRFEQGFAEFVGSPHAIAVSSGTAALEILLRVQGVEGKTVLVPTNTNFATPAAVLRAGGQVRYLDMDETTFAPTLEMVQAAVDRPAGDGEPEISGLIWVHIGGVVSPEFPAVVEYCRGRGLFVLEDAAHAHGSQLGGVKVGALADGAAFSFFPTKVMTTGEGGMITTADAEVDMLARSFRNQGKRGVAFGGLHHDLGNSNRITEFGAVQGLIHLRKLPDMIGRRQAAYDVITGELDAAGIRYVSTAHMDAASQYKLIVLLPEGCNPAAVKQALADDGVILGGTVYELPCHRQPVFEGICAGERYPMAERWCPNHICPPLTSGMNEDDALTVGRALVKHLAGQGKVQQKTAASG